MTISGNISPGHEPACKTTILSETITTCIHLRHGQAPAWSWATVFRAWTGLRVRGQDGRFQELKDAFQRCCRQPATPQFEVGERLLHGTQTPPLGLYDHADLRWWNLRELFRSSMTSSTKALPMGKTLLKDRQASDASSSLQIPSEQLPPNGQ